MIVLKKDFIKVRWTQRMIMRSTFGPIISTASIRKPVQISLMTLMILKKCKGLDHEEYLGSGQTCIFWNIFSN